MDPNNSNVQTPVYVNQPTAKSKTPALACTLCGVLAVAGICFGVYGMFFQPKPTCEPAGQTSSETVADLSVEEVKNLLKNTYELGTRQKNYSDGLHKYLDNFNDEAKITQLIMLSDDILGESTHNDQEVTKTRTISYEKLNNQYHKLFGSSSNLEKKNYDLKDKTISLVGLNYDTSSDSFSVVYKDGIGGFDPVATFTKVMTTSSTTDGVKAVVGAVAIDTEPKEKWTGADKFIDGADGKFAYVDISDADLDKIYNSMKIYEFDFVKEDDGYKLTSITKL